MKRRARVHRRGARRERVRLSRDLLNSPRVSLVNDICSIRSRYVLLALGGGGSPQTLVVLDAVFVGVGVRLEELGELLLREEGEGVALEPRLHDGRDELRHEAGQVEESGPEHAEEVQEQTLDVGAVVVLVGHYYDARVAERGELLGALVRLLEVQAEDLDQVLDLSVGRERLGVYTQ